MHTRRLPSGEICHHHGDYSLVQFMVPRTRVRTDGGYYEVEIPIEDIRCLVADQIRSKRISELEQTEDDDILNRLV
jgi:hypothetical protein